MQARQTVSYLRRSIKRAGISIQSRNDPVEVTQYQFFKSKNPSLHYSVHCTKIRPDPCLHHLTTFPSLELAGRPVQQRRDSGTSATSSRQQTYDADRHVLSPIDGFLTCRRCSNRHEAFLTLARGCLTYRKTSLLFYDVCRDMTPDTPWYLASPHERHPTRLRI